MITLFAVVRLDLKTDRCLSGFEFGWIDCDNCRYNDPFWGDGWYQNATDICRYCATYNDDYCFTHDFAVGWIVFSVIYCVTMILMFGCCCIGCKHSVEISYNEQEPNNIDDIDFLHLNVAGNHVTFAKLTLPGKTNAKDSDITQHSQLRSTLGKLNTLKQQFIEYLYKHNMDLGTFMAIINALISIVGTSITLISQTAGKNGTCINYKDRSGRSRKNEGLKADCTISIVTIVIGVFILLVIAFRYVIPKCKCFAKLERKKSWCFKVISSLVDEHLRGTIAVKFLYFILKPLLVTLTNSSGKNSSLVETFRILYLVLMFCSATALAYITFNKKYKMLLKLDKIMHNPVRFSKTYVATYLLSIIASYSVLVIVCAFAGSAYMNKTYWYLVVYPQCVWLLIVKLYHNELLQLIQLVKISSTCLHDADAVVANDLLSDDLLGDAKACEVNQQSNCNPSGQMMHQVTRLFQYQLGLCTAKAAASR